MMMSGKASEPPARPNELHPAILGTVITFAMTMATLNQFVLGTLAPFLTVDLGLSRTQLGSLTTAPFLIAALASPVAGGLVDRVRDRKAMVGLFLIVAAVYLGMSVVRSYAWLMVVIACVGLAQAMANPVTNKMVARHVPVRKRGAIIGLKQSGVQFGALLSGVLLPSLALHFGWRAAVAGVAAIALAGSVFAGALTPKDPKPATERMGGPPWGAVGNRRKDVAHEDQLRAARRFGGAVG